MFGNVWNLIRCYGIFFLDGLNRIKMAEWLRNGFVEMQHNWNLFCTLKLNGSCLKLESMKNATWLWFDHYNWRWFLVVMNKAYVLVMYGSRNAQKPKKLRTYGLQNDELTLVNWLVKKPTVDQK